MYSLERIYGLPATDDGLYGSDDDLYGCYDNSDDDLYVTEPKLLASSAKGCIVAASIFSESIETVWDELIEKIDLNSLTSGITIEKRDLSDKVIAKLELDFFGNRIVTYFKDEQKSMKLSVALRMIQDLSDIFAQIDLARQSGDRNLLTRGEFITALEAKETENKSSALKLICFGKELAAVHFDVRRVVLITSYGQSSMPLDAVQNCLHIFNAEFDKNICEAIGAEAKDGLHVAVNKIYLGRCILGLQKNIIEQKFGAPTHMRELQRVMSLINHPGLALHSEPLM